MAWPLASQFSAILQQPSIAFRDPNLRSCTIERNEQGQPRPWSGAFAVVYKGIYPNGQPVALRIFTSEASERRERYLQASEYLKRNRPKCMVDFEYRDESVRSSDGKWYPLIVMDWVEGDTLYKWTRKKALENNGAALAAAASVWQALARELGDANIAHGDLQHANIIVTPDGRLKLVDYDCLCVPALFGRRNLEIGVEPYQHPQRNERTVLNPNLDRFSTIVIYLALRSLAVDPSLWYRYVEQIPNDKILFRKADFVAPQQSPLVQELLRSPDEIVREVTGELFYRITPGPIDAVPALCELVNNYKDVEKLLRANEMEKAVELLNQRGNFRDAPEYLKPMIQAAYEYVCRQQALASWQQIPWTVSEAVDRRLIACGQTLMSNSGDSGCPLSQDDMNRFYEARKRVTLLDRIHSQAESAQGQKANLSLFSEKSLLQIAQELPAQYAYNLRPRVDTARIRVQSIEKLVAVVKNSPNDEVGIHKANKMVIKVQSESMVPPEIRSRIDLAERRYPRLKKIMAIPGGTPMDELDAKLLEYWDERLLDDCPQAAPWKGAYQSAVKRRSLLTKLQEAISVDNQEMVVQIVNDPLLARYPIPKTWTRVIGQAKDQVEKGSVLETALTNNDQEAFVAAFDSRMFREYPDQYNQYKHKIIKWTYDYITLNQTNGLKPALGRAGLVVINKTDGTYRLRWTWPHPRFNDRCLVGITKTKPRDSDRPDQLQMIASMEINRQQWEDGGGSYVLTQTPEMSECFVTVWVVFDIGFEIIYSDTLTLGQLDKRSRGWSIFGRKSANASKPDSASGVVTHDDDDNYDVNDTDD